jgi:hypothetical protein
MIPAKLIFRHSSIYHRLNNINFAHKLLQIFKKVCLGRTVQDRPAPIE